MNSFTANQAQRKNRWKQLQIDSDQAYRGDAARNNWVAAMALGLFFASCLVLLAAFLGTTPPDLPTPTSVAGQLRLSTGDALSSLGILATVIVAFAFARNRYSFAGDDAVLESRTNVRLAFVGPTLGGFAIAISLLALFSKPEAGEDDWLLKVITLFLAQVIAFVAAQIQAGRDEIAFVAARELPIYKSRHTLLEEDQRDRWLFRRDPESRPQIVWALFATIVFLGAFVIAPALLLQHLSEAYLDLFLIWLLGMVVSFLFCLYSGKLFWGTRWSLWSIPIAAGAAAVPILFIIWFGSKYVSHSLDHEVEYSAAGVVTMIVLLALFALASFWPFFVSRYPRSSDWRRLVIRSSYPVHIFRWHVLSSSRKIRLTAIIRRESNHGHQQIMTDE